MHTRTTVIISEMQTGWLLRLTTYQEGSRPHATNYTFNTLMQALEAASILKIHVDNDNVLPLKQYQKGA